MIRKRCIDCARCYRDTLNLPVTNDTVIVYYCPIVPWCKTNKELYRFTKCCFYKKGGEKNEPNRVRRIF